MFREQPRVFNQNLINQLTGELNEIPSQITRHEKEKEEQLKKITELSASLRDEEKSLESLSENLAAIRKERSSKKYGVVAAKAKISDIKNRASAITRKISSLSELISSIRASIPALTERISNSRSVLAALDYNLPSLNAHISSVRDSISIMQRRGSIINMELADFKNKLAVVDRRLITASDEISSLKARIFTINDRVSSLRSSLLSAQNRANYSERSSSSMLYHGQSLSGNVLGGRGATYQTFGGGLQGQQVGRLGPYEGRASTTLIHERSNEVEISRLRRELNSAIHDQDFLVPQYQSEISSLDLEQKNLRINLALYESEISKFTSAQMNQSSQTRSYENEILELNAKREKILSYENKISELESELVSKQNQEKRIPDYESEISKLTSELAAVKQEEETLIPNYESEIFQLSEEVSALSKTEAELQEKSDRYNESRERFVDLIKEHEKEVRRLDRQFPGYSQRSQELQGQLDQVKQFLYRLKMDTQTLYYEISTPLQTNLLAYENQHRRNQPVATRLCLAQLADKMNFIQNLNESWQVKFALLCGLLWHSLQQLQGEANKGLATLIHSALLSMHIAENGNLPDELALSQSCLLLYRSLQQTHSQDLRELSANELVSYERKEYEKAMSHLRTTLRRIPRTSQELKNLAETGETVAKFYLDKVNELTQNGKIDSDLSEITKILNQTTALAKAPSNAYLQREYKEAAEKAAGHPSFGKKLGGLLLAFLGAAVTVASVLVAVASFGGSTPLSALGVTVGTGALTKGLAGAGILVGSGMLIGGLGLFNSGKRKAESKIRLEFANAAGKNLADPQLLEEVPLQLAQGNQAAPPPYSALIPPFEQIHQQFSPPPATNPGYSDEAWQEPVKKCKI